MSNSRIKNPNVKKKGSQNARIKRAKLTDGDPKVKAQGIFAYKGKNTGLMA